MNSLHLCTSEAWGGLELYACTIMAELSRRGTGVAAVTAPRSKASEFLTRAGVRTLSFPSGQPLSLANARYLRGLVKEEGFNVVHAHFHRDVAAASLGLRSDRSTRFLLSVYMGVVKKTDPYHRFINRRLDAVLTSSRRLAAMLPGRYALPASIVHYLPYGRDISAYRSDPAKRAGIRRSLGCGEDDLLVGTMVRIDPGKGVIDFIRSLELVREKIPSGVKYCVVGEPTRKSRQTEGESPFEPHCEEYLREIEGYIQSRGMQNSVALAGFQADGIGYLSAMDIFVFPSRDELYSLAVLDAMAMGLPVIAAAAGGNVDQVAAGESGYLYPVGDSRSLAEYILLYARSGDIRKAHGSAGRQFVFENHSMDRSIAELLELYRSVS